MATRIGFTGTRAGATLQQLDRLESLLKDYKPADSSASSPLEFHHGRCVGADEQAWYVAMALGYRTIAHPPIKSRFDAHTADDEVRPKRSYLDRNKNIVDETQLLLAAPRTFERTIRSGTWHTVRYAEHKKRPIIIIWPDGAFVGNRFRI